MIGMLTYPMYYLHIEWLYKTQQSSPFYLLYGREPMLPTEVALSQPRTVYKLDSSDYCSELVAHLSDAWELACQNIQTAQSKQKRQYDKKSIESNLRVNDWVMVHFPGMVKGKSWKLARWALSSDICH